MNDPEFLRGVGKWMATKCPDYSCPACKQKNWSIAAGIAGIDIKTPQHSEQVPFLPYACQNCGFVSFFSAMIMGLDPPKS